jgi:tetratricopeptide (TPR) repeat protein
MREAITLLDEMMEIDRREGMGNDWRYFAKLSMTAEAYFRIGQVDAGLAVFDSLALLTANPQSVAESRWRGLYAEELARQGRIDEAKAQLDRLEAMVLAIDPDYIEVVYYTRALVALVNGDIGSARLWAERTLDSGNMANVGGHLCLALCDLESGRAAEAAAELEFQCAFAGQARMLRPMWAVELRYHLARAYESTGEVDKAADRYREFLDIWKDADPGIHLTVSDSRDPDDRPLEFARRRLEALRSGI